MFAGIIKSPLGRRLTIMLVAVGIVAVLALINRAPDAQVLKFSGKTMGTTYNVVAVDHRGGLDRVEVEAAIGAALDRINRSMNNWDKTSEISRFNAGRDDAPVAISQDMARVMVTAQQVHKQSGGQFDVTLGPLIAVWGFGPRDAKSAVLTDAAIQAARARVGQDRIIHLTVKPPTMAKSVPGAEVNLSAIAKGYGIDAVAEALRALGLKDYMVEIGGDLYASGHNPRGAPWRIGVERPQIGSQKIEEVVPVSGLGMATSGDYRNYFEQGGVRYSHIIDARTGRPITHRTASVTVLAQSAMLADAWATALLVVGQARGMEIAERLDLAVMFIVSEGTDPHLSFVSSKSARFEKLTAKE